MKILITGGCGYTGSVLTERLLSKEHDVTVIDTQWFGNYLEPHGHLTMLRQDVRDVDNICLDGVDVLIHLANIANDPAVELNPVLSWEVNVLATQQLADRAVRSGVPHMIFASSGSVYGVKQEEQVTEDLVLVPISAYNKTKMVAERVLLSYQDRMKIHCIRPATVCGWSPRMRLDVSVNLLTFQALTKQKITVFGGEQVRPNIHILDVIRAYEHFVDHNDIPSGCYNAGFENLSILDIARRIGDKIQTEIEISSSNDPRSYRQNSDKLCKTGFRQHYTVDDAINDLIRKYNTGELVDSDQSYTVEWMKRIDLG